MIFPSYEFLLVFLPLVLLAWWQIPSRHLRLIVLTFASYLFYAWWDWRFTGLMIASTLLDYEIGKRIEASEVQTQRKRLLWVSLVGNLGALGIFKYFDFFSLSIQRGLHTLGVQADMPLLKVVLPVGISFYTFQSLSYSLDIYKRTSKPARGFWEFAAYVAMFPQLVAGPIVRYSAVEDQLRDIEGRPRNSDQMADGVWLFMIGMAKKVWIADIIAPLVDPTFDWGRQPKFFTAWVGALAYTFQLYFDFSGYSDMARGLGKMLGFEFPINFNSPYKARNISAFWNQWHITLSNWLRDYLFIPLGGSREGLTRTLRNLVITMFLGGLWHGAAWVFVVWGLYHGTLLAIGAAYKALGGKPLPKIVAVGMTFFSVVMGWVFFRAPSMTRAKDIFLALFGYHGFEARYLLEVPRIAPLNASMMAVAALLAFFAPNSEALKRPKAVWVAIPVALLLVATLFRLAKPTPFLYFQF